MGWVIRWSILVLLIAMNPVSAAESDDDFDLIEKAFAMNDLPLVEALQHPAWFHLSFLNLKEDLTESLLNGKKGLVVYFGQKYCPYCQKLIEGNLAMADIERYTRENFEVVAVDIHGDRTVTDFDDRELTEREFAEELGIQFTPTLIFYNEKGGEALRITGYHNPYRFRAALEYVADRHYENESYREYLARAGETFAFEPGVLNEDPLFSSPPHLLARNAFPADRPLLVFFEQGECHACDVLHSGPLQHEAIRQRLKQFDLVQLDIWRDTPLITPAGERTTAAAWAEELGLFYTPTLLLFDQSGREIIRIDSVVGFYRMQRVFDYVLSGAYLQGTTLQRWQPLQGGGQ